MCSIPLPSALTPQMSLIVSLRTPDGVVIAGDSLSTMRNNLSVRADVDVQCPSCGQQHTQNIDLNPPPIPTTTFSYAQKIFPFMDDFAVGTFGAGQLAGKTMYFAVRELEQELREGDRRIHSVVNAADQVGQRAHELLKKQIGENDQLDGLESFPDDRVAIGFQVVGYHDGEPQTIEVHVGKRVSHEQKEDVTASGAHNVVAALMQAWKRQGGNPAFNLFSLQDAINYAEFMISTTAKHQEFSRQMESVGGATDIALVTPFDGFQWIQQKDLSQTLEQSRHGRRNQ